MRAVREFNLRAKKMQREVAIFWRKRGRELNDLKKRKEKLENEIKKRDEERKESELHKKRLAFLMKQSDIYAHFMAKKLGIHTNSEEAVPDPTELNEEFKDVNIDEEQALNNVADMINNQRKQQQLYVVSANGQPEGDRRSKGAPKLVKDDLQVIENIDLKGQEVTTEELKHDYKPFDFSNVKIDDSSQLVQTPKSFHGSLKEYQLKGLRWLDNLYEQGINGILADEMGLGKTIQAIALLTHISEKKDNWGPFLIVAPSTTLYNWINELEKFAPSLRILPYWGQVKERRILRRDFDQYLLGKKDSPFHICVTSYNIAVQDEKAFCRLRWQHVILDEAQQIKNNNSQRWKTLMSFKSRNKLLLTGTPLQNNMAELWALLHFIMPKLFDSHEQFQEWFSKDIEAGSVNKDNLNQSQLNRLHAILKPFMLRRVKKDVETEIGKKFEFEIKCELTQRQKDLYNSIKNKLSVSDFFQNLDSKNKVKNLMNLVMQFRKVCNHPELFERRQKYSSFVFTSKEPNIKNTQPVYGVLKTFKANFTNPIVFELPRLIFHNLDVQSTQKRTQIDIHKDSTLYRLLGMTYSQWKMHFKKDLFICYIVMIHSWTLYGRKTYIKQLRDLITSHSAGRHHHHPHINAQHNGKILQAVEENGEEHNSDHHNGHRSKRTVPEVSLLIADCFLSYAKDDSPMLGCRAILPHNVRQIRERLPFSLKQIKFTHSKVCAPPITYLCADYNFERVQHQMEYSPYMLYAFFGSQRAFPLREFLPRSGLTLKEINDYFIDKSFCGGLLTHYDPEETEDIVIPSFDSLIADSAKLRYLDVLLADLKREGHRVLIFCQMTKMMNLLEEYLTRRRFSFFRLDGNTSIGERNQMVKEFQSNPEIFAFILSTRAGGLGITLTAADTVIFYDNDWNPTMDAQATDRAHRIGQVNDVSVYR
jgi:DNA helicase INO80